MVQKSVNFWDAQKKNNWSYFKDVGATVPTKVKGQLVSINYLLCARLELILLLRMLSQSLNSAQLHLPTFIQMDQ